MSIIIFWSWQSQLPNSTNKGFIEDCIDKSLKKLESVESNLEISKDKDTLGTSGSVDIANTIFSKIDKCNIFIADVSFTINNNAGKLSPNPNVLLELGYAAGKIGWENIILIFNKNYGNIENLPFDIRGRLLISYELKEGDDKSEVKKKLISSLHYSIKKIIDESNKLSESYIDFFNKLSSSLSYIRIYTEDFNDCNSRESIFEAQNILRKYCDIVRKLSINEVSKELKLTEILKILSDSVDNLANYKMTLGCGDDLIRLINNVMTNVVKIWNDNKTYFEQLFVDYDLKRKINEQNEHLKLLLEDFDKLRSQARDRDLINKSVEIGIKLRLYSLISIKCYELYELSKELHHQRLKHREIDGGRSMDILKQVIIKSIAKIDEILSKI